VAVISSLRVALIALSIRARDFALADGADSYSFSDSEVSKTSCSVSLETEGYPADGKKLFHQISMIISSISKA
jgi:hypothetical protein